MAGEQSNYVRVGVSAVQALVNEESTDFEVFLPGAEGKGPVLYRRSGVGLSPPDFDRMREHGVPFIYLSAEDFDACEKTLESKLGEILRDPDLGPGDKVQIAHAVGTSVAENLTQVPESAISFGRASNVLDNMIEGVLHDPIMGTYLMQMAGHDRTTAGHMFMVSMLAVLLGLEVFGPDRAMLKALGSAGMLHDLGKLAIAPGVLNKAAPLTREEQLLVQQHPIESVRLVGNDAHMTPVVRQMIMQHHERMDGRGYPLGLTGVDLLPSSRLLSIVDSFHALIGPRSYRAPLTPAAANRVLVRQSGRQFDPDLLARWIVLFERCSSQRVPIPTMEEAGASDEPSSKHEHCPIAPPPKVVGPRPRRFVCHRNATVRCVYAGRLQDVSPAPGEFIAVVHDISRSGLCIRVPFPMYRGEVVYVHIDAGSAFVWLRSMVAWCRLHAEDGYRIGLRLDHRISSEDTNLPAAVTAMPVHEAPTPASPDSITAGGQHHGAMKPT